MIGEEVLNQNGCTLYSECAKIYVTVSGGSIKIVVDDNSKIEIENPFLLIYVKSMNK